MTSKDFKVKFINYCNYLQGKKRLEEEIDYLYYRLSGVKAIRYDKIPTSYNPELSEELRLELCEQIERKIKEYQTWNTEYEYIRLVIRKLNTDEMNILVRLLVKKETYEHLGRELGYSSTGMWKYVESIIEGII